MYWSHGDILSSETLPCIKLWRVGKVHLSPPVSSRLKTVAPGLEFPNLLFSVKVSVVNFATKQKLRHASNALLQQSTFYTTIEMGFLNQP